MILPRFLLRTPTTTFNPDGGGLFPSSTVLRRYGCVYAEGL